MQIPFAQARVIGGGSSINAEVFTRGCPEDYDRWANEEGCPGWSSAEVMPYFLRLEGNDTFAGEHHGTDGPLGVSSLAPHAMTKVFVQACQQAGIPYNADFNGSAAGGLRRLPDDHPQRTALLGGGRLSPAARWDRRNLQVETECLVTRILVEGGRAVGVEIQPPGPDPHRARRARSDRHRRRHRLAEDPDAVGHRPGRRAQVARNRARVHELPGETFGSRTRYRPNRCAVRMAPAPAVGPTPRYGLALADGSGLRLGATVGSGVRNGCSESGSVPSGFVTVRRLVDRLGQAALDSRR